MTSIAASERALLAATAQQLGPDAPTLCDGWSVRDLVLHLLVREGSPVALLGALPPLRGTVERVSARRTRGDFAELVRRFRDGPPLLSPFRLPLLGAAANGAEFLVHHEDLRRAQPEWAPRPLSRAHEDALWRGLRLTGRPLLGRAPVGVVAERTDTGERARLRKAAPEVTLRGLPSELLLYAFGRQEHAVVEAEGDPGAVAALGGASLGV